LESEYRGEPITTQYSYLRTEEEKTFCIPKNVFIIGTMNDIDRSVESMDFALRRRFAWKEVSTEYSKTIIVNSELSEPLKTDALDHMSRLNILIADKSMLGSTAWQIGGAYFLKLANYQDNDSPFELLWQNHLLNLLFEYLRGYPNADDKLKLLKAAYDGVQ